MVKAEATKLYEEIIKTGYKECLAKTISDEMMDKGGYMFNKSHSFAYAVLTLQTAYLKAHYPLQYMTALLCSVLGDYATISKYINDSKHLGLEILPPDILKSERNFSIYDNKILFGLEAIKNVGEKAVDVILENRDTSIKSLRLFLDKFNELLDKKTIVYLIKAGCFGNSKKKFFLEKFAEYISNKNADEYRNKTFTPLKTFSGYTLSKLKEEYGIEEKDKEKRLELFNIQKEKEFYQNINEKIKNVIEQGSKEFCEKYIVNEDMWEFEALSMFITSDPFEKYNNKIRPVEEIEDNKEGVVLGVITDITKKTNKKKQRWALVQMYCNGDIIELNCWAKQLELYEDLLKKSSSLVIKVKKRNGSLAISEIKPFSVWIAEREGK